MSSLAFTTPTTETHLRGWEYAWIRHLSRGPGRAAWDLNYDSVMTLLDLATNADYLNVMREQVKKGVTSSMELVSAVNTFLAVTDMQIEVAGFTLHSMDLEVNTALAAGSDPIRLAAKLAGWGEIHAWVDGPDRAWLADVIEEGLTHRIYRRELTRMDDTKPHPSGWDDVMAMLRANDTEPVVTSYSGSDGWLEPLPGTDADEWYELPLESRWELGMEYLASKPYLQITPESLGGQWFDRAVTVWDVMSPERVDRVTAAIDKAEGKPA
jgi:hypothetical protein